MTNKNINMTVPAALAACVVVLAAAGCASPPPAEKIIAAAPAPSVSSEPRPPAPVENEPFDIPVATTSDGKLKILVPPVVFRVNTADFNGLSAEMLRNNDSAISQIAASLNRLGAYNIRIEGYVNPVSAAGTAERAAEERAESGRGSLSERRAEKILALLAEKGVARNRMIAVGLGISSPVVVFADTNNVWQNRRVEFYLDK